MRLSKLTTSIICAVSASILTTGTFAADNGQIINMPSSQLHWETTKEGVGFAPLQGDRFNESYMAIVRLPAGLISPAHVKSANMYGMVVSGTITNLAIGADPSTEVELAAGSYYKIPAGLAHISKCVSAVDCVTFLYQDGKFDFLPVGQ
ncbi:MAG: hypothetical protein COB49_08765 [Alphaproteobacteria bacterium]|nr:MAG: hypothetical protein COB49_08765 [Alphaproteobacteria bacterium]